MFVLALCCFCYYFCILLLEVYLGDTSIIWCVLGNFVLCSGPKEKNNHGSIHSGLKIPAAYL